MNPLLSIIVPTKNRYYYLKYLVQYFHSIESDKIELIIQDNSDVETNQDFLDFLSKINDSRISYLFVSKSLTIDENCDFAIKRGKGEYITMLGDDDIFSKHIIEYTEKFKVDNLDAILPIKNSFTWPDVKPRFYKEKFSGIFRIHKFNCKRTRIDVKKELEKVIKLGGTDILNLPRIYHGILKKTILDEIYNKTNTYFPGPSPDMANAVAACKYVERYELIDVPLIISGHSKKSGGGQGAQGQHFGEISELPFLPKKTASNWTKEVPYYWSGYTIYAESVIQALKRTDMAENLKKFNFEYLIASCLVFDTNYKDRIYKVYANKSVFSQVRMYFYFIKIWIKRLNFHFKINFKLFAGKLFKSNNTMVNKDNIYDVALYNDKLIEDSFQF